MDPLRFDRSNRTAVRPQLTKEALQRELDKAYAAFRDTPEQEHQACFASVASGLWGCGVARGNPDIKCIVQWMAASLACKDLDLYTDDARFRKRFTAFVDRCPPNPSTPGVRRG